MGRGHEIWAIESKDNDMKLGEDSRGMLLTDRLKLN